MTTSNSELARARAGDREALAALLTRHEAGFLRIAEARLRGRLRAKVRTSDLVQQALLVIVDSIPTFRGETEASFAAWAARIIRNRVKDQVRFFAAQKRHGEESKTPNPRDPTISVVPMSIPPLPARTLGLPVALRFWPGRPRMTD